MKKKLISLFLIVSLFSFIGVAQASDFDIGKSFNIKQVGTADNNNLVFAAGSPANIYEYSATGESGEVYEAFCIDPHLSFMRGDYTVQTGESSEYLAGVSAIISSGGSYSAKDTALRAFTYGFMKPMGLYGGTHTNFQADGSTGNKASGFTNLGVQWACSSENSSYASQLGLSGGDCASTLRSKMGYSGYNSSITFYDNNTGLLNEAQSIFNQAMAAAANAKSGSSSSSSEGGFSLNASLGDVAVNESTVEIIATFDFEGATVNDYIKNINFQLNGSGYELSTIEYTANGETNTLENNSETNIIESLVSSLEDGATADGTVTLKITLNKTFTDEEECEPATFTISYLYSGSQSYNVVILKINNSIQDMIIGAPDAVTGEPSEPSENDGTLEGEIPCEEGEEVCGTYITTPICSDDEEKSSSDIVAPEDIKKCILDNTDDFGNDYKLSSTYGGIDNNSEYEYCQVFCKEDYKDVINNKSDEKIPDHGIILQPMIEDVVCGGYFQLKAHIEGAKDCYTGGDTDENAENGEKSIDKEKYLEDVQRVQRKMVDALNNYNEAKAKLEGIKAAGDGTRETFTCGDQSVETFSITVNWSGFTVYEFVWDEENEEGSVEESTTSSNYNYVPEQFDDGDNVTDDDPNGYNGVFNDELTCNATENEDGSTTYTIEGEPWAEDAYNKWKNAVQTQETNMKTRLETLKEEYKTIILAYNSCVTGWYVQYDFAHTLRYYYDETYEHDGSYESTIPYYNLIKGDSNKTILVPDEEKPFEYVTDVVICKETATNEYECDGEPVTIDDLSLDAIGERVNEDEYGYGASYSGAFDDKDYVICDTNECKTDQRKISQASFVKKSVKKSQDYISPSVFWQSEVTGKVTATEAEGAEELEYKLPVSTRSVLGGTFRLMLEDLGEFYEPSDHQGQDKYGRLIDYNGGNEDRSVAKALGYNAENGFDGDYECYYVNNCAPDDCPNCDFIDTGIPNCPNCNFTPTDVCINCIFNLDELQINVKPITNTEVINPSRDYGYNWITDTNYGRLELISQKAEQTINEITEQNDLIYSSTKYTDENGLAFSINLTPSIISYLKEYNASHENAGGYANDSLTCEDAQFGETTVKNLFCKSEVIDYLLEDEEYRKQIPNVDEFESKRNDVNSYWTTFPNWEQIVGDELTDAGQNYVIGGPAWK